jgi:hypothetical protein
MSILTFPTRWGPPSYLVARALSTKTVYVILSSAATWAQIADTASSNSLLPVLTHTSVNPQFGLSLFPSFFTAITHGCRFCMGQNISRKPFLQSCCWRLHNYTLRMLGSSVRNPPTAPMLVSVSRPSPMLSPPPPHNSGSEEKQESRIQKVTFTVSH